MDDELAYLRQRLAQELARSQNSVDREARVAHATLADHYRARIDALTVTVLPTG